MMGVSTPHGRPQGSPLPGGNPIGAPRAGAHQEGRGATVRIAPPRGQLRELGQTLQEVVHLLSRIVVCQPDAYHPTQWLNT